MANDSGTDTEVHGMPDLFSVRGIALEAMQRISSHEKLNEYQFASLNNNLSELKRCLDQLTEKTEEGFKRNDNRFWSLGISLITLLISCCGFLIWEIIAHGAK